MKNEKITVVMVAPNEKARVEEIGTKLEDLQAAVGGWIEAVYPFDDDVCIVCNEEGKYNGMMPNRALYDEDGNIYDIIFGQFFICDCSGEDFASLNDAQIEVYMNKFLNPEMFFRRDGKIIVKTYEP